MNIELNFCGCLDLLNGAFDFVKSLGRDKALKWVKSLKSGLYRQCGGCLRKKDLKTGKYHYCCLGVLGNIDDEFKWQSGGFSKFEIVSKISGSHDCTELPIGHNLGQDFFIRLNDDFGLSFKEIAIFVESRSPGVMIRS